MQKILAILTFTCFSFITFSQTRNWDKPMQLKSCTIQIKANPFTATTLIEMEFYNPNNQEIEGLHQFQLQPGQAITAFQLDLHGKYRDGSIEEKWKAANAYNTIVGKRIDPALLQMDSYNNYSLRIYPVAAKSTRKITMTIEQLMKVGKESLEYILPLNVKDTVGIFEAEVVVSNSQTVPFTRDGMLIGSIFQGNNAFQKTSFGASNVLLNKPISFHIPLLKNGVVCTQQTGGANYFALRMTPSFQKTYPISPKKIKVYWDVSASGNKRNISKEIAFLKQYTSYHNIEKLDVSTFNYKVQDSKTFSVNVESREWISYLRSLEYDGATQIGCIDLTGIKADAVLIFTDGNNSYGKALPTAGSQYIYCVHASSNVDNDQLEKIVGETGGRNIDLLKASMHEAIQMAGNAENMLMDIRSLSGKSVVNFQHYYKDQNYLLVTGTATTTSDSLIFYYGNDNHDSGKEAIALNARTCSGSAINRIQTLSDFDALIKTNQWQEILFFGKEERIVTPNTSYIVLERIGDYVKYQIDPPVELEDECAEIGFVKSDKMKKAHQLDKLTEQQILSGVVQTYNARIKSWGDENTLTLSAPNEDVKKVAVKSLRQELSTTNSMSLNTEEKAFRHNLNEVVVVGYGSRDKRDLTGAVSVIRSVDIMGGATSVEQVLSGKVTGLFISPTPNSNSNELSSIRIRGMSSITGNNQPLFILDGLPVSGNINDVVNTSDIESISVLKDAGATAIYGSRGSNGVIIINTKRGRNFNNYYNAKPYRLAGMEDVDYLVAIKATTRNDKWSKYKELQLTHGNNAGFYLDMAQHFHEAGYDEEAITVLSNAAEVAAGNVAILKAMAFTLEQWGAYDEALTLYEQVKGTLPDDLRTLRNIALIYFQKGDFQKAVYLLYAAITKNTEAFENANKQVKSLLLNDLNAIVAVYKNDLNLSAFNKDIFKSLPVDLRVVVECNSSYWGSELSVVEPGGSVAQSSGNKIKNGGYITPEYNYSAREYQVKEAKKGKYVIRINHYNYHSNGVDFPLMIKLTTYKNFGKWNQSIHIQNVIMDNQHGTVEVAEIKW